MTQIKEVRQIREVYINKTEKYRIGEDTIKQEDTEIKTLSDLFKYGKKNYGRCISKVFIDSDDGKTIHIGYVFEKKDKYTDTKDDFIKEVWVTIEHYTEIIKREYQEVEE